MEDDGLTEYYKEKNELKGDQWFTKREHTNGFKSWILKKKLEKYMKKEQMKRMNEIINNRKTGENTV